MRVFLGTKPIAGVLWEYRQGLQRLGVDVKVVFDYKHRFGYLYDEIIYEYSTPKTHLERLKRFTVRILKTPRYMIDFDVFHFLYGNSLMPLKMDVKILRLMGKKVVMNFLGSDIRCSTPVLEGTEDQSKCDYCKYPCDISRKKNRVKYWAKNADAIISGVDNSQLLDYYSIPYHILPLPCDIEYWKPFDSTFYKKNEDEVLIVHAPSNMQVKGTPIITESIQKLSEKYNINFQLLHNMQNTEVREWLNVADIVVDQFGCGWHGKLAVESMALAKPTLCYINEGYKKKFPQFKDMPIINITPKNLYTRLESLIIDQHLREKIGKEGRLYVEKIHDGRIVCSDLLEIYQQTMN